MTMRTWWLRIRWLFRTIPPIGFALARRPQVPFALFSTAWGLALLEGQSVPIILPGLIRPTWTPWIGSRRHLDHSWWSSD